MSVSRRVAVGVIVAGRVCVTMSETVSGSDDGRDRGRDSMNVEEK